MHGFYNLSTKPFVLLEEQTGLCKEYKDNSCSFTKNPTIGGILGLLHSLSCSSQTTLSVTCFILKTIIFFTEMMAKVVQHF